MVCVYNVIKLYSFKSVDIDKHQSVVKILLANPNSLKDQHVVVQDLILDLRIFLVLTE